MNNCLNCGKEIVQTQGKRERKFCSPDCKTRHWYKTHPKKKKKPLLEEGKWYEVRNGEMVLCELQPPIDMGAFDKKPILAHTISLSGNKVFMPSVKPPEAQKSNEKGNEGESVGEESRAEKRPKTLYELKAMCPKEFSGLERSTWISENRQKYGV